MLADRRPNGLSTVGQRLPGVGAKQGEGGLLGLAVSPTYARDRLVYAYMTTARDNRIVRFRLGGAGHAADGRHAGSPRRHPRRRADRVRPGRQALRRRRRRRATRSLAQDRRVAERQDPADEPRRQRPAGQPVPRLARSGRWGHRNVQGLAWDAAGRLWATEFGQNRCDEVNLIRKGRNYGWPDRRGRRSPGGGRFVNPLVTWPTTRPRRAAYAFEGHALRRRRCAASGSGGCRCDGTDRARRRRSTLGDYGRIRTPSPPPDGSLWITTSNRDGRGSPEAGDDRILRVDVGG